MRKQIAILVGATALALFGLPSQSNDASVPSAFLGVELGVDFNADFMNRINGALNGIAADNFQFYLPNGRYSVFPYNIMINNITVIYPGVRDNALGFTNITGRIDSPIYLTNAAFDYGSQFVLREVILHEADHHRYGVHTCGETQDVDDNGPFGVETYYALRLYWNSATLDASQRQFAASWALSRAQFNMCNNAGAYSRALNAYQNNVFPVATIFPVPFSPPPFEGPPGCRRTC